MRILDFIIYTDMLQKITLLIITLLFSIFYVSAWETLKIWTIERKPFSYLQDWKWTGFSIDLFKQVALKNDIDYSFVEYKDFSKMLNWVENNQIDWAVANISITLEREKIFDFSSSIYDSWLNILSLIQNSNIVEFAAKYMSYLLKAIIWIVVFIFVLAHIFWLIKLLQWFLLLRDYFSDILEYIMSIISQTKSTFWLKIFSVVFIALILFIVSYFSQTIVLLFNESSQNQNGELHYSKLKWKDIWVTNNSTAMHFLESRDITTQHYNFLSEIYSDLYENSLEYIVADEPVLQEFIGSSNSKIYSIVWKTFNPESYWFLFQNDSPLLEDINVSLLEMWESWEYENIYDIYFQK